MTFQGHSYAVRYYASVSQPYFVFCLWIWKIGPSAAGFKTR